MSSRICSLIRKDFTILLRSKISTILILILPLLIVLAAGYALDSSNLSNVYIGIHSNYSSDLSQNIITQFENSGFKTEEFGSSQECIDSLKMNSIQICTVFYNDSTLGSSVKFYVDYSRINLANTLINEAQNSVNTEADEEGKIFVQDLINTINLAKETLPQAKLSLASAYEESLKSKNSVEEFNVGTEKIDAAISYLEDANSRTNDSTTSTKISNAIQILTLLKQENGNLSIDLEGIISSQESTLTQISEGTNNINSVLESANSKKITDTENIISPIKMQIEALNEESKNRDYMIPVLISLIALFTAILLSSTFVFQEKKTIAYFRNFMTPTKSVTFLFATYLTCLIILLIQFTLVLIGIKFILNMNSFVVSPELGVILILAFTTFIFIGMFIGNLFNSEEAVIFASMITAGAFLFFSNIILPIENISSELMKLSSVNPLVLLNLALKKIILFNLGFGSIQNELIFLAIIAFVFAILSYFTKKITIRKF